MMRLSRLRIASSIPKLPQLYNQQQQPRRCMSFQRWPSSSSASTEQGEKAALFGIVGVNLCVYLFWQSSLSTGDYQTERWMWRNFTVSRDKVKHGHLYHTLLSSTFSHKDTYHLFSNMFTLSMLGQAAVSTLGAPRFVAFYLGSGVFSSLCYVYQDKLIPRSWPSYYRSSNSVPALGASGSVAAVVALAVLRSPRSVFYLFPLPVPIPAPVFGLLYLAYESRGLYLGGTDIGNSAHLGGALCGIMTHLMLRARRR